jgi:hypothetical protein
VKHDVRLARLSSGPVFCYLILSMFQALRSRCLALTTLAAFLLAQPAVGCAALCLIERHMAGAHTMQGMSHGSAFLTNSACHPSETGAVQRIPLPTLSPMESVEPILIAVAPGRSTEPIWTLPAAPRLVSHLVDPPPPRLA